MEVATTIPQRRTSERIVVQTDDVPVPQTLEEIVEVVKAVKIVPQERFYQPGDQACRVSADAVHRQGCRYAYCDTATGSTVA